MTYNVSMGTLNPTIPIPPRPPPVLIVLTHRGMARLSRPGSLWLNTKMVYPRMVTHLSTNGARHRATTLIETNALPISQAAESKCKRESVGGWRKHKVLQWMSLALFVDRKGIRLQKLCIIYPSWNILSFHFSSFTAVPSPICEGHGGWGGVNSGCMESESQGRNQLTWVYLGGRLLNQLVCVCVCVCSVYHCFWKSNIQLLNKELFWRKMAGVFRRKLWVITKAA